MRRRFFQFGAWVFLFLSLASETRARNCQLDQGVPFPADLIENKRAGSIICKLDVVCDGSPETVYCRSVGKNACPDVATCFAEAFPLKEDAHHLSNPKPGITDLKKGDIAVQYDSPPVVIHDGKGLVGSTCAGEAEVKVKKGQGVAVGTVGVACTSTGAGCPGARECARDPDVGFSSNEGRVPAIVQSPAAPSSGSGGVGR